MYQKISLVKLVTIIIFVRKSHLILSTFRKQKKKKQSYQMLSLHIKCSALAYSSLTRKDYNKIEIYFGDGYFKVSAKAFMLQESFMTLVTQIVSVRISFLCFFSLIVFLSTFPKQKVKPNYHKQGATNIHSNLLPLYLKR